MAEKRDMASFLESLRDVLDRVESDRPDNLDDLRQIQIIGQALFQQEAARLRQKLGQDHPRVRQLEARMGQNLRLVNELEVELEIARIQVPEVEEGGALVHGRVADEGYRGVVNLTVGAEDEAGNAIRRLGTVETDGSGYYALRVDPATVARLAKKEIFLVVRNEAGEVVHRASQPLELVGGERVAANVALKREELWPVQEVIRPTGEAEGEAGADLWVGQGRVTDEKGQGLGGLLVRLFDKDRRYDDKLGAALTDESGAFAITYRVQDFREGKEPGPDLYLTVTDKEGMTLYTSEGAVRFDAGRVEVFAITIAGEETGDRRAE